MYIHHCCPFQSCCYAVPAPSPSAWQSALFVFSVLCTWLPYLTGSEVTQLDLVWSVPPTWYLSPGFSYAWHTAESLPCGAKWCSVVCGIPCKDASQSQVPWVHPWQLRFCWAHWDSCFLSQGGILWPAGHLAGWPGSQNWPLLCSFAVFWCVTVPQGLAHSLKLHCTVSSTSCFISEHSVLWLYFTGISSPF